MSVLICTFRHIKTFSSVLLFKFSSTIGRPRKITNIRALDNKIIYAQLPIVIAVTAHDLPTGEIIILQVHNATMMPDEANTLLSTNHLHHHRIIIKDVARSFGGKQLMIADGYVIPFVYHQGTIKLRIRRPTETEILECKTVELISDDDLEPSETHLDEYSEDEYLRLEHPKHRNSKYLEIDL